MLKFGIRAKAAPGARAKVELEEDERGDGEEEPVPPADEGGRAWTSNVGVGESVQCGENFRHGLAKSWSAPCTSRVTTLKSGRWRRSRDLRRVRPKRLSKWL